MTIVSIRCASPEGNARGDKIEVSYSSNHVQVTVFDAPSASGITGVWLDREGAEALIVEVQRRINELWGT